MVANHAVRAGTVHMGGPHYYGRAVQSLGDLFRAENFTELAN